ncbi:unnamed protein product [Somion occarium]|uniref:Vta1/callose synthase N-terminal domain-containing protein n=1 Tax=Somion occarium TaxID=3059160 RepID=A0ABP1CHR8_9APHY
MALLGLPPIPPQLKPLIPYLQRADELKVQDPIIAYWCAYHAAQIGISLKVKEPAARHFLFELLGTLEHMKKEIGPNDAIEEESASSAYVENFALKVFAIADNEDRAGRATRATAKKFLAAANFLEVLSVFGPSSGTSVASDSTNAEKILYAKWKAADIAKAYREGRKPTPGPANAVEELPPPDAFEPVVPLTPSTPPPSVPSGTSGSPPSIVRSTPPPPHLTNIPSSGFSGSPPRSGNHLLPGGLTHVDLKSPGSWSTMATPGTPDRRFEDDIQPSKRTAFVSDADEEEAPSVAPLPTGTGGVSPTLSSRSIDTTDTEGRKVRFSPSVTAGLSSATTTPSVDEPFNKHFHPDSCQHRFIPVHPLHLLHHIHMLHRHHLHNLHTHTFLPLHPLNNITLQLQSLTSLNFLNKQP